MSNDPIDTVTLPREPTDAMIKAAIEAGISAARRDGQRATLGEVIRAEYAAMVEASKGAELVPEEAPTQSP